MTEKKSHSKEEILKWVQKNRNYGYYTDNKYENPFEKLHQNALNCSDRDKLPQRLKKE